MHWKFASPWNVSTCMARLCDPNIGNVDELNPFCVEAMKLSDSQVYLVYKGRRFSKGRRTEYNVSMMPDMSSSGATVTVVFNRELFNLSYPMTPITELDAFLKLALNASRME